MSETPAAVNAFTTLCNECYQDKEFTPVSPSSVDFGTCVGDIGRAGWNGDAIVFKYDPEWWRRAYSGDRVGLLCHEVGHIEYQHHKPSFWEQVVENYHVARDIEAELVKCIGDIDWEVTKEFLVEDPTTKKVDNRSETAFERRREIAEELGFTGDVTPFENMRILVRHPRETSQRVKLHNLDWQAKTIDDILDYFYQNGPEGIDKENGKHFVDPIPVTRTDERYEVVERDELAELVSRCGQSRISVNVVSSATIH